MLDQSGTLGRVMLKALTIIEFVFSALIIASVLLQQRSTGLGGAFASDSNVFRSKRGIEKFLFNATIASAVVLVVVILTHLFLRLNLAV
jgi:preprotein translocase subunit SecG